MIEKLPSRFWKFWASLKQNTHEIIVEDFVRRIPIHEETMKTEKAVFAAKANVVEHGQGSKGKQKDKGKGIKLDPKDGITKKPKAQPSKGFQGLCFI